MFYSIDLLKVNNLELQQKTEDFYNEKIELEID